jgi:hypothetical protein
MTEHTAMQRVLARRRETRKLRRLIERPERCTFWGQPYTITPRLIAEVFGDGAHLICITPLATRPNYFVARVDSATSDVRDPSPDSSDNLLDDIICAAQEEYGYFGDSDYTDEHGDETRPFPVTDWGIGVSWSESFSIADWRPAPHRRTGRQRTRARWAKRGRR